MKFSSPGMLTAEREPTEDMKSSVAPMADTNSTVTGGVMLRTQTTGATAQCLPGTGTGSNRRFGPVSALTFDTFLAAGLLKLSSAATPLPHFALGRMMKSKVGKGHGHPIVPLSAPAVERALQAEGGDFFEPD
jgi:hypothetical protein